MICFNRGSVLLSATTTTTTTTTTATTTTTITINVATAPISASSSANGAPVATGGSISRCAKVVNSVVVAAVVIATRRRGTTAGCPCSCCYVLSANCVFRRRQYWPKTELCSSMEQWKDYAPLGLTTQRHTETHTLADTHTGIHTNAAMLSIGLSSSVHIKQFNLFLSQLSFY